MAVDKLVDSAQLDADLTSVADAIRTKGGTSAQLAFPAGFVSAVQAIPTGSTPTGTKQVNITQNGTVTEDVAGYANAEITTSVSASIPTKTISNLAGNSTTWFTGYLNSPTAFTSQNSTNKEVTTDYIDVEAYAGQTLKFVCKLGNRGGAWLVFYSYKSDKTAASTTRVTCIASPSASQYPSGVYIESDGVSTSISIGKGKIPSNAKYIRVSLRTYGNAELVISNQDTDLADYANRDCKIVLSGQLTSDGTAS